MSKKTVLITGGSKGIGSACAELFASKGYRIVLNYFSSEKQAADLAFRLSRQGADVLPFKADVSDFEQVKQMVEACERRFGAIDVLVSNAGISEQKLFADISPEDWRRMMAVTVDAAFYCCSAVLPGMLSRKKGKIVLVSSIWGMVGASCEVHYSAAKAALIGLTKSLAKELGPSNINVNCVAPGIIDTDMNSQLSAEDLEDLKQQTPLRRLGTPQQVAETIFFLACEKSDFITGQVISPNGGFVI